MKTMLSIATALVVTLPALAFAASPNYGCDSVNFGPEVLAKMPNAQKLCRGIKERNGTVYVHYIAQVESKTASTVTVKFLDKDDKALSRVTFEPMDQTLTLDEKATRYSSLDKGQKIDLWIANSKWGLYANPDGKAMKVVSVERM